MSALPALRKHYDAIVVGARCAGASTARLLARAGARVLVVERSPAGADTLSTHALMRGGVLQLHRWGLLEDVRAAGTPAVRTTAFHYGDVVIEIPIKDRDGVDALYAPRRTTIDGILARAARDAGADVLHGVRVVDVARDRGAVRGVILACPGAGSVRVDAGIVIGADGLKSGVARLVKAGREHAGRHATGVIYAYARGLDVSGYEWHYRPGVSAGVIPTNDGMTCVFVAMPARRLREELPSGVAATYHRVLSEAAPRISDRMARTATPESFRVFPGMPGVLRRAWGKGWALVGDAGYFRDPVTAHGMTDALRDAELLARAVLEGGDDALADYQERRDGMARGFLDLSDEIASFSWDLPALQRLHHELSRNMGREVEAILGFGDLTPLKGDAERHFLPAADACPIGTRDAEGARGSVSPYNLGATT